jgi:hypothetical protein
MTMIAGYKNHLGDLLIAADSKATFGEPTKYHARYHSELQKIYFFNSRIAVAFATLNVLEVKRVFKAIIQNHDLTNKKFDSNRFIGILKNTSKTINVSTEFILGILHESDVYKNKMYYIKVRKYNPEVKEINNNECILGGSVIDEGKRNILILLL